MTKLEFLDDKTTIEVDKQSDSIGMKTITFKEGNHETELTLSDANYQDLKEKMSPDGIMPEDFSKKVDMLNQLLEELSPIIDVQDTDYTIKEVKYGADSDNLYFYTEEL